MITVDISGLVPGGILETDFVHVITNDGTCSRCRGQIPEDDVPLMFWINQGRDMLIYCDRCLEPQEEAPCTPKTS